MPLWPRRRKDNGPVQGVVAIELGQLGFVVSGTLLEVCAALVDQESLVDGRALFIAAWTHDELAVSPDAVTGIFAWA